MRWDQEAEDIWVLLDDGARLRAVVTRQSPYLGPPRYSTSGAGLDEIRHFDVLEGAQSWVERRLRECSAGLSLLR